MRWKYIKFICKFNIREDEFIENVTLVVETIISEALMEKE